MSLFGSGTYQEFEDFERQGSAGIDYTNRKYALNRFDDNYVLVRKENTRSLFIKDGYVHIVFKDSPNKLFIVPQTIVRQFDHVGSNSLDIIPYGPSIAFPYDRLLLVDSNETGDTIERCYNNTREFECVPKHWFDKKTQLGKYSSLHFETRLFDNSVISRAKKYLLSRKDYGSKEYNEFEAIITDLIKYKN